MRILKCVIMTSLKELTRKDIESLLKSTIKIIGKYFSFGLTIPFALKGNLGEFIVYNELLDKFSDKKIILKGGAFPGIDITIEEIRIQVKTQIKHEKRLYRKGSLDFESSPTIRKNVIDEKKCDIIVLVVLYLNDHLSEINKKNIYIFNQSDFCHFSTVSCFSGKSEGDYTIFNIIDFQGIAPPKEYEKIKFYNTRAYKKLFNNSKDNWKKIEKLLNN